jgi:DNA-binding MarR family transcriptional regulator
VLEAVPMVHWFIRRQMRSYRGGLSLPQFRALVWVDRQPSASLSVVAEHLGASLPTASRIVAGLVAKGLLARQGCAADRRQLSLRITARGRAMLQEARRATRRKMEGALEGLSQRQRGMVRAAMRSLRDLFGSTDQAVAAPAPHGGGHNGSADGPHRRGQRRRRM